MDALLTRKHNSYSEAFTHYLASGLQPKTHPDVMVTIRRFPYEDGMVHVHQIMRRGAPSASSVSGYVIFEFGNESEDIMMLQVSPEDLTHFAKLVGDNGQLNRELLHRMVGLLHGQVKTSVEGVHHWSDLREAFLDKVYGVSAS
jgi:hypothetical protein